jgi:hypothetical protein
MHPVLRLQRAIGNQAVQRMVNAGQIDRQSQQSSPNVEPTSTIPPSVQNVLRSPGHPLPSSTRSFMEPRFGEDFSQVRVHTDTQAADSAHQVNALAYTVGSDVVFGAGQYAPETSYGKRLLAHELTHVVQQQGTGTDTFAMKKLPIGVPGDAFEKQADTVANRVTEGDSAASDRISATPALTLQRVSIDDVWEGTKSVASSVGETIASVGEEAWEGTKSVVSTVEGAVTSVSEGAWEGAKNVASTVEGAVTSAGQFVGGVVSTGVKLATGETSLAELIGIPEPSGDDPSVLAIIIRALQNPVVQALPGYILPPFVLAGLQKAFFYVQTVSNMMQNSGIVVDMIKGNLQEKINTVPGKTQEALAQVSSGLGENGHMHLEGIWRHLGPKLEGLKNNWWSLLKKMAWEQLWPLPGIWEDMKKSWRHVKALATHAWHTQFSLAIDDVLALLRDINGIAGRLSLWLFLGLVIGYAIAGGVAGAAAGGVTAIPGALAGAGAGLAMAAKIGEAILIATVAVETATILKSVYNLAYEDQTLKAQECNYERIANSSVTIGLSGALVVLGWLAARLAKAVIRSVAKRVWNLPVGRGLRDPATGERIPARGDVIEFRVALARLLRGLLKGKSVQWLEAIRRDFYVIDLLEEGEVEVTARKGKKAPLYTVRGGRLISVKSTAQIGARAAVEIQGWIEELANFEQVKNVVVDNPTGRTLIVALKEGLSAADVTALRNYGSGLGVQVEIIPDLPPDHPGLVAVESIPVLLEDMGLTISDEGKLVTVDDCGEEQEVDEP